MEKTVFFGGRGGFLWIFLGFWVKYRIFLDFLGLKMGFAGRAWWGGHGSGLVWGKKRRFWLKMEKMRIF